MKSFSARILAVIAILSVIVNVLLYFRYTSSRPIVTVGTTKITKKQFQDQMEHDYGQTVLSKLVFDALVSQAAAKNGVTPTADDVDAQIAVIERRSPQVLTPYGQDPGKMLQFRRDLTTSIALENLRIKEVALTPAQVSAYYNQHKSELALPQQVSTTTVVAENSVDAATAADLLRQNDPADVIGRQPRLHVVGIAGYSPDLQTLQPALKQQINAFVQHAKIGDVKVFRAGKFFLIFRVSSNASEVVPPLDQIRGQVERLARLERAPSAQEELARLYHAANPKFNEDRYAAYFTAMQDYPLSGDNDKKATSTHGTSDKPQ